ncbi:MAG TPA: NUDIX hydrolase [Thermoanaerobaculia bacterium]|nr:NUDIX hydrolase [Thermoanaerobaculia bacterium]
MTDPYRNKRLPRLTVDAWIRDRKGRLLLVRRGRPPFRGRWCLPGGFCEWKETTEACCARETKEETGLDVAVGSLLGVYSRPDRDPRGHNVTVLYAAKPVRGRVKGGDDAAEARWFTPRELCNLPFAFDHGRIVSEQLARPARQPRVRPSRRGRRAASPGSASRGRRRT